MLGVLTTRVRLFGEASALGWKVLDGLAGRDDIAVVDDGPADVVVEVGIADYDHVGELGVSPAVSVAEMLTAADAARAAHVVVVTSAMVYGALPNNPIPLSEEAVLRPEPSFVYARQLAAAEELVEGWRQRRPGRTVSVLRPAVPIDQIGASSLARALTAGLGQRFGETDPGAQFVHHDDVASAVALAVGQRLDGVFNVAPDGSIPGDRLQALTGRKLRLPLPDRLGEVVGQLRWRFQRGPIPPGLRTYVHEPWVVANDKLRATGWQPTVTNEQAFVEGTESPWWSMVTPQRRQELALGLTVVISIAGLATGGWLIRRWWRVRNST